MLLRLESRSPMPGKNFKAPSTYYFMFIRNLLFASCLVIIAGPAQAQQERPTTDTAQEDNLMSMLSEDTPALHQKSYVAATFKATRIINGHSIENVGQGVLDFRVSHRFGAVKNGIKDFFGLDGATTRLGLDYGITNWLMVGIGRSTLNKEVDGSFKAKVLRQTESGNIPVSLSVMGSTGIQTTAAPAMPPGSEYYFSNRVAYTGQLLIARKFSNRFSMQLMPTVVHYNLVPLEADPNNVLSIGVGGRLKLSQRISLTGEYYYNIEQIKGSTNALAFGMDIETGGHVFQLMFTNSNGITDRSFIGETTGTWGNSDIHFGFNISRVFTIVKPKGMAGMRNKIW